MELGKKYVVGVFDDDSVLMSGVKQVREKGIKIFEVFTPFPVHGLEDVLGYKRSKLPIVSFLFAMTGLSLALSFQLFTMTKDWPMIIGGKPFAAFPDFVPVTFEFSILLGSLGMVATFFVKSDLKPHKKLRIFDLRSTDDRHIVAIDLANNSLSQSEIEEALKEAGAEEVNLKDFDEEEKEDEE